MPDKKDIENNTENAMMAVFGIHGATPPIKRDCARRMQDERSVQESCLACRVGKTIRIGGQGSKGIASQEYNRSKMADRVRFGS